MPMPLLPRSSRLPSEVVVPLVVVLAVADTIATADARLLEALLDTICSTKISSPDDVIIWRHKLAVRVQVALCRCGSDLVEPVGRCIDAALCSCADGTSFKPWSHTPLPGLSCPTRHAEPPCASSSFSPLPGSQQVSLACLQPSFSRSTR